MSNKRRKSNVEEYYEPELVFEEKTETDIEESEPTPVKGVVADCKKLRLRKEPNLESEVLVLLNNGDSVTVDLDKSTEEWIKVSTENGIDGYCMRKFILI